MLDIAKIEKCQQKVSTNFYFFRKSPAATSLSDLKLEDGERATLVDVYMPSVRMAQENKSVNRTVTLPAWLNAAALERNFNFSQILQDALKAQLHIGV